MTNISPISWENDWPVWGINNVIPDEAPKPILGQPIVVHPVSTDFDGTKLPPDFRWNHNPDDTRWSLAERPGYLRLRPTVASGFWTAKNTLTHKGFGPTSQAVIEMDISSLQMGDVAGLGMLGKGLATVAVKRLAGGQSEVVLSTGNATAASGPMTQQATAALGAAATIFLTLRMDFEHNLGQAAYSIDGVTWSTIGVSFPLFWDWATGTFQGEQYAVFNYNAAESNGFVDVNRVSFTHRSDFDMDGDVDLDDYSRLRAFHLKTLVGDSPLETFAFGDADGDLDNDYQDFRAFKQDYIAAHGLPAFNALLAKHGILPEPTTMYPLLFGVLASGSRWRAVRIAKHN